MPNASTLIQDSIQNAQLIKLSESSQLMNNLTSFYDSAWSKLIYTIGILGALIGILLPIIINYFQFKSIKNEILDENKKLITETLNNLKDEFNIKLEVYDHKRKGGMHHLQGNKYFDNGKKKEAMINYFKATECYILGSDLVNLQIILNTIIKNFDFEQYKTFNEDRIFGSFKTNLEKIISNNEFGFSKLTAIEIENLIKQHKNKKNLTEKK
jgi:hypothetical protein